MDVAIDRRVPVSCESSGWLELRALSSERVRGREPTAVAVHDPGPHAGAGRGRAAEAVARVSVYARPALVDFMAETLSDESHVPPTDARAGLAPLVERYRPPPGHFDELLDGERILRPAWQT